MLHFEEYLTCNNEAIPLAWHFTFHQIPPSALARFNIHNDLVVKYGKH